HADGANMLADALQPHGGILIWRAFVYGHGEADRHKKAYADFVPHDGSFRENAIVQVKNGAIDFQPREPFHPLFGSMPNTNMFMEFQVTQEYLGQGNHVVYLGPMWQEILQFDTHAHGPGSSVGSLLTRGAPGSRLSGMAAVSNIGDDPTWCGSHMHPANWYAYGRLAWDYTLDAESIAREWITCTFDTTREGERAILELMMDSWEACIDYMTPLGLHHIMQEGHHYGPDPGYDAGEREDWRSTYYHRADAAGLGFDRSRSGTGAVDQYHTPVADMFDSVETCPEDYLLWFHHVPWDYQMSSGRTLKDELKYRYARGVARAEQMHTIWKGLHGKIDSERWKAVLQKLWIQVEDAREWQEVCTAYFMPFSEK
ncbi:MAG: alpha-glucuronidase, partial [Spirochaeta sp.]